MSKVNKYSNLDNLFILPSVDIRLAQIDAYKKMSVLTLQHGGSTNIERNLNMSLAPVDKPRFVQNAMLWRNAIREAERAVLPQRYLMQLQYMDTVLDAHTKACLNTREGLQFERLGKAIVCDNNGNVNKEWTAYFQKPWFRRWVKYVLEAKWFGYSLISMGDIIDGQFKNGEGGIVMIPRTHISPDRLCVQTVPQSTTGPQFLEEPYIKTHMYIATSDQHALTACGYGLLYEVTLLAIGIRDNLQFNQQFLEIFGMPFRWIQTDRTDAANLNHLEAGLALMGSLGYMIVNKDEEIHFEDTSKGSGFKGYGDLEMRIEKKISKIILGHSDAIDSAGKTPQQNSSTGMGSSPQALALARIEAEDGDFLSEIINERLFEFMRMNGINIPRNLEYRFTNDAEDQEVERVRNTQNLLITQAWQAAAMGGIQIIPTPEIEAQMGWKLQLAPQESAPDKKKALNHNHAHIFNAMKTNSPEFKAYKEKMDRKPPSGITEQQWADYRTEMEYKKLTKGFDKEDERKGLDKEDYIRYSDEMKDKDWNKAYIEQEYQPGDSIDMHINCSCEIDDEGYWQINSDDPCDDCISGQAEWNASVDNSDEQDN